MKRIITINRQFGSGGREVGKRLADELKIAYYDKELIAKVAEETGFDLNYISRYEETAVSRYYPFSFGCTLSVGCDMPQDDIYIAQARIIKRLGEMQDCVIIGRCAGYILKDAAFKIFIYASSMKKRIERCYEKVPADRAKSEEEMKKSILSVDKCRSHYYAYYTGEKWLDMRNYNLCIDTAKISIKQAVKTIEVAAE